MGCEHKHWFAEETTEGAVVHVCEDCHRCVTAKPAPPIRRMEP